MKDGADESDVPIFRYFLYLSIVVQMIDFKARVDYIISVVPLRNDGLC